MSSLYHHIQTQVTTWREANYPCPDHPAISEILAYATVLETGQLRYLRAAQFRALETYWYLRLIEKTPQVFELYKKTYPGNRNILTALDLFTEPIKDFLVEEGIETLWEKIRNDPDFVRQHRLESVHETLTLSYPSYIFALAMGAGKTRLIGAIIATEFALALEYHPEEAGPFVQNALVFAPGLTILESLRELAEIEYARLLPPRLFKTFDASYKLTITQDGQKDLPVIRGSRYNLIVSNTEKIRIQKRTLRRHPSWTDQQYRLRLEEEEQSANLRLLAVASLPNLGVFSDEAHHTYGVDVGKDLKRVRQTVDYLHEKTNLIVVVNTTGTPYYQRQPLKDVVIWYGLAEGIRDNILKSVDGNVVSYDFPDPRQFVGEVVRDFFTHYRDVQLPNGAAAKLALYFPQNDDLETLRPVIESTLTELGLPLDVVLRNTDRASQAELDAFNRLNHPEAPHRVILLVNKGTEGWNCPSLFACALARKLRSSANFILQASTRCLRQVPGNPHKAKIYLSAENRKTLDQQLQETYGETLSSLNQTGQETRTARLVLKKWQMPPLRVKKTVYKVVPRTEVSTHFHLDKPAPVGEEAVKRTFTPLIQGQSAEVLVQIGEERLSAELAWLDVYTAAGELAALTHQVALPLLLELRRVYKDEFIPRAHLLDLAAQIENQIGQWVTQTEEVEVALALVKPEGFETETDALGQVIYTTQIVYQVSRAALLLESAALTPGQNPHEFGFHYDPYNFDSLPEKDFFTGVLRELNVQSAEVEDVYFTGGLTDPAKTDFYIEYETTPGKWARYSPDFVIRRKDGRCLIVEIKAEKKREDAIDGQAGKKALAVQGWVNLNPDLLQYEMVFTPDESVAYNQFAPVRAFLTTQEFSK